MNCYHQPHILNSIGNRIWATSTSSSTIDSSEPIKARHVNDLLSRRHSICVGWLITAFLIHKSEPATAAIIDYGSATPTMGPVSGLVLTTEIARNRLREARVSLKYLVENYSTISMGGGDNVRRYLGTVGVSSGLYGIIKVLKYLQEEAADVYEYTESLNEFDYALRAADTAVYSANFVEYSAAKTKPATFFADAQVEIDRMQVYLDKMTAQLNLK